MTEQAVRIVDPYHAIGYVVAVAAEVEFMASQLLIRVGVDPRKVFKLKATGLIKEMNARSEGSDLATKVAEVLDRHRAGQLFRQRNNLVHGRLLSIDQPDGFAMGRIHTDGTSYMAFWSYDEYLKFAIRFGKLRDALIDYLPHLRPSPPDYST